MAQETNDLASRRQTTPGATTPVDPGTLKRLLELLPLPRHSSAAEEASISARTPDVQLSGWYASGPAAAPPVAQPPAHRPAAKAAVSPQAAVLRALQMPDGLAGSPKKQPAGTSGHPTVVIHVDAFSSGGSSNSGGSGGKQPGNGSSSGAPAPAVPPAPLPPGKPDCQRQLSLSLPDHVPANPQPQVPAVLAQLHPKFRKMAEEALQCEAAGTCRPRPTCTQRASPSGSPAQAPGSPQRAGGRQPSSGAAGTAGGQRPRPPAARRSPFDPRVLDARIQEVKRCGGTAAALAAAVRASLADHDAALLRQVTERVNSARSTPRATPRARPAVAASTDATAASGFKREVRWFVVQPKACMYAHGQPQLLPLVYTDWQYI